MGLDWEWPHEGHERSEPAMHAFIRARPDVPSLVQVVQVGGEHVEQVRCVFPVAEELLHVEQRVQRRQKLRGRRGRVALQVVTCRYASAEGRLVEFWRG